MAYSQIHKVPYITTLFWLCCISGSGSIDVSLYTLTKVVNKTLFTIIYNNNKVTYTRLEQLRGNIHTNGTHKN
jgi:hypothetical protein